LHFFKKISLKTKIKNRYQNKINYFYFVNGYFFIFLQNHQQKLYFYSGDKLFFLTLKVMINLAIFVSGSGTNCESLIRHFENSEKFRVALVVSNKSDAYALIRAKNHNIPTSVMPKAKLNSSKEFMPLMTMYGIQFIVLAGFLPLVPDYLIEAYPNRIVNLHPALLPKYGGKGMWGHHVHEAVKASGETETGMTVHYVSAICDGGEIIVQHTCSISPEDTAEDIAAKEHELEMKYYAKDIEDILLRTF
jgi:phosphoribosylglycinamide formyltransferase-1